MRTSSVLALVALAVLAVDARPYTSLLRPRQADSSAAANVSSTDLFVLQFADVLERLESTFYSQATKKFNKQDYKNAGFVSAQVPTEQLERIASDETTHAQFLNTTIEALGGTIIPGCEFDFSSVLTSVDTVVDTARVVELTGVGAYLGAAHLLDDPSILTTAATIATVESRHQTILNALANGGAIPTAFDVALLPQEVLALAGAFISGCDVGVDPLPAVNVTNKYPLKPKAKLYIESPALNSSDASTNTSSLFCQTLLAGSAFANASALDDCKVPSDARGPLFVWITNSSEPLSSDVVVRGASNVSSIVAGPSIVFVDDDKEALGSIIRGGSAYV